MGKSKNKTKRARSTEPGRTLKSTKRSSSTDSRSWVQQDVAIIPTKLKDLEGKVKAKDGEIEALQQLLDTKNKCSAKQAKLLKKKQAEDKKQIAKLAEKMDAKESEVASVQNTIQSLEDRNDGLRSEIESLESKLKQSVAEAKSSAKLIKSLKKEKTQLTNRLTSETEKAKEASVLSAETADLRARLDDANGQIQTLQASGKEATHAQSTNSQLMTQIAELEVELAKVVKQHEKSKSTSEHLALKLEKSEGLCTALTEQLETAQDALREIEERTRGETAELTQKLEVLQQSHESHVLLKEKMTEMTCELEELKKQKEKLQSENENYSGELAVIKDAYEETTTQLASKSELVETTEQMYNEASKAVSDLKELKKTSEKKDRRLESHKKEVQELKRTIEILAQDKADRDERIRELLESRKHEDLMQVDDLAERQRARSAVSVESARFATSNVRLSCVSLASPHSTADPVDLEGTPYSQKSILKKSHQRSRSRNRVSPPDIDYDIPQVHTPKHNTAPAIYAQHPTRTDKDNYKAALDMQVSQKRALSQSSSRRREMSEKRCSNGGDFFKFGVAGSGAPIRDQNNDVITNVTYTRSTNYLPVDHPMSTKKNKRITRHF